MRKSGAVYVEYASSWTIETKRGGSCTLLSTGYGALHEKVAFVSPTSVLCKLRFSKYCRLAYWLYMMEGEERQNGDVQPEPNVENVKGLAEVDLSSSEHTEPAEGQQQEGDHYQEQQQQLGSNHQLEFFEGGGGHDSGADSNENSPGQVRGSKDKDSDSTQGAFVTVSPPISPGEYCICIPLHSFPTIFRVCF